MKALLAHRSLLLSSVGVICLIALAALRPDAHDSVAYGQTAPRSAAPAASPSPDGRPIVLARSVTEILADKIARQIIAASPPFDSNDPAARDAAGVRLAQCKDLIDAAAGEILWGGFHPKQGYDPEGYRLAVDSPLDYLQLTEFSPAVWAKLYLSTFMFPGPYEIRQEGPLTVVEIEARFRGDMDPGEYPYPFWHSPNKWTAYINTQAILLVFKSGRLVASMRKSPPPEALRLVRKKWDAQWMWKDGKGHEQPRVALFSYLFSPDNPHVTALDTSYRALEENFRALNCMTCHAPDNRGRINELLLLNYPNQALVMRRTLVAVLEANEMPPGSVTAGEPTGIQDPEALDKLITLAKEFEKRADAAAAYEQLRAAGQ